MNKQQEALKLALEALERVNANPSLEDWHHAFDEEVVAIREALADSALERMAENARELGLDYEPAQQQEPVAYSYTSRITGAQGFSHHPMPRFIDSESWDIHPLYTSPPASKPWVGLTQQEQASVLASVPTVPFEGDWHLALFTAIEAKLKEKNERGLT